MQVGQGGGRFGFVAVEGESGVPYRRSTAVLLFLSYSTSTSNVVLSLLHSWSKINGRPAFGVDCLEMAEALVAIGRKYRVEGETGEALLLHGLDMLKRGGEGLSWNVLASELLKEGRVLDAKRFARGGGGRRVILERRPTR